ncbi:MAG: alpha/beta hydrolase fold domain-containing protein [Verrucomicrobiota bacterium]
MKSLSLISPILLGISIAHAQQANLLERFDQFDRNADGNLTREEMPRAEIFNRLDVNGDGIIQRQEISRRFSPGDRNKGYTMPDEPAHKKHLDLRYRKMDGVDPNLHSLDLYIPTDESKEPRPVMIMIHGGGWRGGDKANASIVGAKMAHFVGNGYIYASINYRLSPASPDQEGPRHPAHAEDCAAAIAWIHDNIAEYGGDPDQLHLMGHSAGAHLAGIVGTNERFLKAHDKPLSILKTNVLLDTAAIDIPGYLEQLDGRGMTQLYHNAFTDDPEKIRDASPMDHIEPDKDIPPTILFYGGDRMALHTYGPAFAKALTQAGSPSVAIDTVDLDHGQINSHVGMIGDPMTPLIMRLHAGEDASKFPTSLKKDSEAKSQEKKSPEV